MKSIPTFPICWNLTGFLESSDICHSSVVLSLQGYCPELYNFEKV